MTRDEIIAEVQDAFGDSPRPRMFIRNTCECQECQEHEQLMQSFNRNDLPIDELDNPGWDPICFASDEAFLYLMPGLVELAIKPDNGYIGQFLFHISGRISLLSQKQAKVLLHMLDFLVTEEGDVLDLLLIVDDVNRLRERLGEIVDS